MGNPYFTLEDIDHGAKEILERVESMKGMYVTVGVHEDAGEYDNGAPIALVAQVNEYGGITHRGDVSWTIPERSFMRSTMDENREELLYDTTILAGHVVDGDDTAAGAIGKLGFKIQELIKAKIQSGIPPENAESTLKKKRGTKTLIDSRLLLRSISSEVHHED